MRPIDADALKASFEEDGHLSGYIEEYIDYAPTLDLAPKWISVNGRLPADSKKILVVNGHGYISISALWRKDGSKWTWIDSAGHFNHVNDITHWMPLPEPPKGES
jgi:hypothetical protein